MYLRLGEVYSHFSSIFSLESNSDVFPEFVFEYVVSKFMFQLDSFS